MTVATADADGRPWASPVWFARASATEFLWVSHPDARHSRNLASRSEMSIVIFDSTVPLGKAEAVYLEASGEELSDRALKAGIEIYAQRSAQAGASEWTLEDVTPPARSRLYRATASAAYVLGRTDERIPVRLMS
jgi:hypothetical protein